MDAIRQAFERCARALSLRPMLLRGRGISRTRVVNGVLCEIEEGRWKLSADLPPRLGGRGEAPTPGVLGRAAFGSCLAIGYMMHAARLGVPITSLEVEVEADYDNGVLFGVANPRSGCPQVRYTVTVESPAADADVRRVIDEGDTHSPYLHVLAFPQAYSRTVRVVPAKEQ